MSTLGSQTRGSRTPEVEATNPVAKEVRRGLTANPKHLPPWLFYDAQGSRLFEEITRLPEYYLTRTELSLFLSRGPEMISAAAQDETLTLIELGAGSALKTQVLIRALLERQGRATFYPIDVSRTALEMAVSSLSPRYPSLEIIPVEGHYVDALETLSAHSGRKLVAFLGSSIGNFTPEDAQKLLSDVRHALSPGDALLLGTDLHKPEPLVLPAYDDAAGVTARFNKNLLERLNRELGANFDLSKFKHVALWNEDRSRVELHLESLVQQTVHLGALKLDVPFAAGERIHTENSYKFTLPMVDRILEGAGFVRERTWTDRRGYFGEHLARVEVH